MFIRRMSEHKNVQKLNVFEAYALFVLQVCLKPLWLSWPCMILLHSSAHEVIIAPFTMCLREKVNQLTRVPTLKYHMEFYYSLLL